MKEYRKQFWENVKKENGISDNYLGNLADFSKVQVCDAVSDAVLERILNRFSDSLDDQYYTHNDETERATFEFEWLNYKVQFIEWACGYYMTVIAEENGQKFVRCAFVDLFRGDWMLKDDYQTKIEWAGVSLEVRGKSSKFCEEHGVK